MPLTQESPFSPRFTLARGWHPDWRRAADACMEQLAAADRRHTLAFLYVSDRHADALPELLAHLQAGTRIPHWTGSLGIGLCSTGEEHLDTPGMVILATDCDENDFRILPSLRDGMLTGLAELAPWLDQHQSHVGIVHGDPRNGGLPTLLARLADTLPGGFLAGGLSSSRVAPWQIADGVAEGGVSGVVFSDRVEILTGITQGCTPIGETHTITRAERHLVEEIDGRPALDVFHEEIGEILARNLRRVAGYVFVGFPQRGSDTADYLVRNLLGVDLERRVLAVSEEVTPGQPILFCRRDGTSAWEDLQRMLEDLARRLDGAPPAGGLYFSCLGRGREMFGEEGRELRAIRDRLGDFPLAGFFAGGEIHRDRLYGYTGVLVLFRQV